MIAEIALFCLILAFVFAVTQTLLPVLRTWQMAIPLALLQFGLISSAFGLLILLRVISDFSVANVAQHSSRELALIYRISGAWGNHEGSMLLWVWVLSLFGAAASMSSIPQRLKFTALSVHSAVCAGFLLFILCTSNPFARIFPPPPDGAELNPLLQDIGLALHPPLLYLGYVGFAWVFSLAVAGLLIKDAGREWAKAAQPWIMVSWSALTLGIGMGSWWAYRELGWGGWWFWDPVENASLLPWLAGTALLHSNKTLLKRGQLAPWVLLLAILTFTLSLLGTFLVRSGVLTSVHSFASDPLRGYFILAYMAAVAGTALCIYAQRVPYISTQERIAPLSREGMIVINNLFLITLMLSVLLGTLYPLFAEWFNGYRITVGAPYFNTILPPIAAPLLVLAGIAPLAAWQRSQLKQLSKQLYAPLSAALAAAFLVLAFTQRERLLAATGMALAAWLFFASLLIIAKHIQLFRQPLSRSVKALRHVPRAIYAVFFAHLGVAVIVAGITGSSVWKYEMQRPVHSGDIFTFQNYTLEVGQERTFQRSNHIATSFEFTIRNAKNEVINILHPEYRVYTGTGTGTSEATIISRPWADFYVVVGEPVEDGGTAARIYYNPMMQWIWSGFLLMTLGGILSIASRKRTYGTA